MRRFKRLALFGVLLGACAATSVSAQSLDNAMTYSGLAWAFSTGQPGFSNCGTLLLDATGAVGYSANYALNGQLQCPALGGSYASVGTGYFNSGGFNMTVSLSVTHQLVCANLSGSTLSGSCPIYDNLGAQTGTAFVSLL